MLNKQILFFLAIFFCSFGICFCAGFPPTIEQDLEWSDYGLNFRWCNDNQLLAKLNLTEKQKEQLNNLVIESTQTVETQETIKMSESELKNRLKLVNIMKTQDENTQIELTEIESLINQVNTLRDEQYKTRMMSKAKLKILLSGDQRSVLYSYFRKKEAEQKAKMKEQMREEMGNRGGGFGSPRGREGAGEGPPPFRGE
ncbi:MAG: hypothetical protein WC955_04795 [Elusimicrobiota bacterium]